MRLRSTGLGKTELEASIETIERVGDFVIFHAKTIRPVRWRVRVGFQEKDLRKLVVFLLRPRNLRYIVRALFSSQKKVRRTEAF